LDQFSPRQSRPHFKIASIAAAGASQSKDRNDKQKTGFFDSIRHEETLRSEDFLLEPLVFGGRSGTTKNNYVCEQSHKVCCIR
jgi:hypothetical protein